MTKLDKIRERQSMVVFITWAIIGLATAALSIEVLQYLEHVAKCAK